MRARNASGITYANGSSTAWWNFTVSPLPGAFNKISPANGATDQPTNPSLSWQASKGATSYEYCLDTSNDHACNKSWVSSGGNTSLALSGLIPGTTYYWQVRARNAKGVTYSNGHSTTWRSFTITPPPPDVWTLVWRDEFNGSGSLDTSSWICDTGTGWGTGEVENMSCGLDNIFQSGGSLHIRALHSGTSPTSGWTSGRIETLHTDFQPPAGGVMRVEGRIQLPNLTASAAQGYWPAFWMLGEGCRSSLCNWPKVGEMDIMENINGLNTWWGTFHCGIYPDGPCNEPSGIGGNVSGFSPPLKSDYHSYRLIFDKSVSPQEIRWYVDGVEHFNLKSNQVDPTTWRKATQHGFFVLFDLAMGGNWSGNPTSATASGGTMLINYVRVYVRPDH